MLNALLLAVTLVQAQATPAQQPQQSPAEAKHQADIKHDEEFGKKASEEVKKECKLSENKEYIERVQRIGAEMAAIARVTPVDVSWGDKRLNPFKYQFTVLKGEDVNAFSLPGGYIYVYEGLVKYVESDDELAGVLGHEISHAAFRHFATLEREQNKLEAITLPLVLLAVLAHGGSSNAGGALMGSQLLGLAVGSGWSLKAELAADQGGYEYISHSKYNPTAMLTVMERLARDERNQPNTTLGIFQSHPPSKERAQAIKGLMARAHVPVRRSSVTTSLRTIAKAGENGSVELWFGKRKLVALAGDDAKKRADEAVAKLNEFFDKTPEIYEIARDDDSIVYKSKPLLELTTDDAKAANLKPEQLVDRTFKAIQGALYTISFRTWDRQ